MVAKDELNKPTQVPGLVLENREEVRRFLEAIKRKEIKNLFQEEFNNAKTNLTIEQELFLLDMFYRQHQLFDGNIIATFSGQGWAGPFNWHSAN